MEYRGLAVPVNKSNGGYFVSTYIEDLVWSSILLILFTPKGGMPGMRTFGTAITDLLFEQVGYYDLAYLQMQVQIAIEKYEPRVTVKKVETAKVQNTIYLTIGLIIKSNQQYSEKAFQYTPEF